MLADTIVSIMQHNQRRNKMPFSASSSVPCFSDMEERLERAGLTDGETAAIEKDLCGSDGTQSTMETPEILLQAKKDLDATILATAAFHKSYYKIALAQNREVTERETDWIAFLRSEHYELKVHCSTDVDSAYLHS